MKLESVTQESLLTLLCLDDQSAFIIRNSLPATAFEGTLGEIARQVYPYIDRYKKAPKSNLDNILKRNLNKKGAESKRIKRTMSMIRQIWEGGLNAEYQISKLDSRLRYHRVKEATRELFGVFNAGLEDDEAVNQMEDILNGAVRNTITTFNPGIYLGDKKRTLTSLLRDDSEDIFPTGIKQLDDAKLGPRRKGLHLFVGLKKVGKTRWLVQLGQHAAMQGAKVLHISLEMDEDRMVKRYYQAFFAIADKRKEIKRSKFKKDEYGRLIRITYRKAKVRLALDDRNIRKTLANKLDRRFGRQMNNIIVKSFPTRQLSFRDLVAYLDRLEIQEGFIPDLLIVDYAKIMKIDMRNFRLELGALIEDLRGLGVERNMAVATVGQARRPPKGKEHSGTTDSFDIGEDFSMTQTLDVGLSYRQTPMESKLNVARIKVSDARDVVGGWEVMISQNYSMGQFCIDSIRMRPNYWTMISKKAGTDDD